MDELFSCRNCIYNPIQTLNAGGAVGFCQWHGQRIDDSERTTCKYLHRKDLPLFLVDEGVREHADEFKGHPGIARLDTKEPISRSRHPRSEDYDFFEDEGIRSVVLWGVMPDRPSVTLAICSGVDATRSLIFSCLVRQHMVKYGASRGVARFIHALIQTIAVKPVIRSEWLTRIDSDEAELEAVWDLLFARLATLQEYGWHIGDETLLYATEPISEQLATFQWPDIENALKLRSKKWLKIVKATRDDDFRVVVDDPFYFRPWTW